MSRKLKTLIVGLCLGLLWSAPSRAILTIDITQGTEAALPIAIVPFGWQGQAPQPPLDVAKVISDDLSRSGRFAPQAPQSFPSLPVEMAQVRFDEWRVLGGRNLVIGRMNPLPDGNFNIEYQLFDVLKGEQVNGFQFVSSPQNLRRTAHQISDLIYEALLGERGVFNTRIAYITVRGEGKQREYQLNVADADGAGAQSALTSNEPLLSPAWSPDGRSLAYVSLENKRSAVYVQDVSSGRRNQVAAWPGLNSAPAWSPDGTRLALSLSKDGNPEIYVLNLTSRGLARLTNHPAIDTEPAWSPDGQSLVFTSDRGGKPQIYRVSVNGGNAERVTYQGDYNARASYSPDGTKLVFLNGDGGAYRIGLLDLANRRTQVLTTTSLDESPCFAPNGSMILYATGNELAAVSVDGRVRQRLAVESGLKVREPAWSPLLVR